jgi:hypothetical protein
MPLFRLTRERDLLQRQKTNISLVSDNLQLVQVQLEGADHMQKIVLQVRLFPPKNGAKIASNFFPPKVLRLFRANLTAPKLM